MQAILEVLPRSRLSILPQRQWQPHQQRRRNRVCRCTATAARCSAEEQHADVQTHQQRMWASGRRQQQRHQVWTPHLDPPPLLQSFALVLVQPKRPVSIGTVVRACACFELEDVRIVAPRCDVNNRNARSATKGAQYILQRAQVHSDLASAVAGCSFSAAFTRWVSGRPHALPDLPSLLRHPAVEATLRQAALAPQHDGGSARAPRANLQQLKKVALVFGREEAGLTEEEVGSCGAACSIAIGRLQESLSLSHAVSVVLSQLFQAQLRQLDGGGGAAAAAYVASSPAHLAAGLDVQSGTER